MRTALAAAALAAAVTPHAAAAQPAAHGAMAILRPCAASQLRADVVENGGAMLHRELRIALTNVSQRGCALAGYPAVRLLDAAGNVQIVAETFVPDPAPRMFVIGPGGRGAFSLRVATGDGVTTYRSATALAIVPPGDVAPVRLALPLPIAPSIELGPIAAMTP